MTMPSEESSPAYNFEVNQGEVVPIDSDALRPLDELGPEAKTRAMAIGQAALSGLFSKRGMESGVEKSRPIFDFNRESFIEEKYIPLTFEKERDFTPNFIDIGPKDSLIREDYSISIPPKPRAISSEVQGYIDEALTALDEARVMLNRFNEIKTEYSDLINKSSFSSSLSRLQDKLDAPLLRPRSRPRYTTEQLEAAAFRRERLQGEAVTKLREELADDPIVRRTFRTYVSRRQSFREGTQLPFQLHRQLTPALATVLSEPGTRRDFIEAMNADATRSSDRLKEQAANGGVDADLVIVGNGVTAAILASELRAMVPDANIVSVANNQELGGQFMSYGPRPVFGTNSRNFRREQSSVTALPGRAGNLNSFGPNAAIQVPDYTQGSEADNILFGAGAATNLFTSVNDTMFGADLAGFNPKFGSTGGELVFTDTSNGEMLSMRAPLIALAGGLGERKKMPQKGVWTVEELFQHFGNEDNLFPMDFFTDKRVAMIGFGDSGRTGSRLLNWLAPREAYGKSTVQFGGPKGVMVFGANFTDRETFCAVNRPIYHDLASSVRPAGTALDNGGIVPNQGRVVDMQDVQRSGKDAVVIRTDDGQELFFDLAIDCRQLESNLIEAFYDGYTMQDFTTLDRYQGRLNTLIPVARVIGAGVMALGPGAKLKLSDVEQETYNSSISENTAAIWANALRTPLAAQDFGFKLQSMRSQSR